MILAADCSSAVCNPISLLLLTLAAQQLAERSARSFPLQQLQYVEACRRSLQREISTFLLCPGEGTISVARVIALPDR